MRKILLATLLLATSCHAEDAPPLSSKIDIKNSQRMIVDDSATPKSIQRCVLYEASPSIEKKDGSPIGVEDIIVPLAKTNSDIGPSGFVKFVYMPRETLRAMFNDPEEKCAAHYLFVLKVNGRTLYEVRAVAGEAKP